MNRKRMGGECYRCYHRHLNEEQAEVDEKLKRRIIWTSAILMKDPKDNSITPKMVKIPVSGAFNRGLGHDMPNSLYDKNKRDRVLYKLRKRGVIK